MWYMEFVVVVGNEIMVIVNNVIHTILNAAEIKQYRRKSGRMKWDRKKFTILDQKIVLSEKPMKKIKLVLSIHN